MLKLVPLPEPLRPRLGAGRVLKPYPLEAVHILGNGATLWPYVQHKYYGLEANPAGPEVWAMNSVCFGLRGIDKVFSCYTEAWNNGTVPEGHYPANNNPEAIHELRAKGLFKDLVSEYKKTGVAVVVTLDGNNDTLEFPLAEVIEATGEVYFVNTHSYMLALAIACGVKLIYEHGCDYDYGQRSKDYEAGKPCAEFWHGIARARGIEIRVHPASSLMSLRERTAWGLYGYGFQQPEIDVSSGRPVLTGFKKLEA